jgi:pilus assembly protein CpaC
MSSPWRCTRGEHGLRRLAIAAIVCCTLSAAAGAAQPPGDSPVIVAGEQKEAMTVGVGQSVLIETPWPVARVSIAEPAVADVEVLTPRQILLMGKSTGATDLIVWNEREEAWHTQVSVVIDLTYLKGELRRVFPDSSLDVVQSQQTIVVIGQLRRAEELARLKEVMDSYEVKYVNMTSLAGVQQVLLKVRVAEVSRQAIRALGVNAVYGDDDFFGAVNIGSDSGGAINPISIAPAAGSSATGNTPFIFGETGLGAGVTLLGGFPGADLQLFIEALAENQYVRILAQPSLIAMSGEQASFLAGGEFPIPVVQGSGASGVGTSISIQYKEFGVRLNFRPLVLGENRIRLFVAPEVSELSDFGAVEVEGFRIPSVLTRRVDTTLELNSGQTFAMAGLLNESTTARRSRVPVLGDIPVLGALFRSVRYVRGETELVVLVTASVVEPSSSMAARPVPGALHRPPHDWELYLLGEIEGGQPAPSPPDAHWLRELGMDRLRGPGAWISYDQRPIALRGAGRTMPEAPATDEVTEDEVTEEETGAPP